MVSSGHVFERELKEFSPAYDLCVSIIIYMKRFLQQVRIQKFCFFFKSSFAMVL